MSLSKGLFTSTSSEWRTPKALFDELNAEFDFTVDAASTDENALCVHHYTKAQNGLKQSWGGVVYSVIRLMGEKLLIGYKRQPKNRLNQTLSLFCSYQHDQTRPTGTSGFLVKQAKFAF